METKTEQVGLWIGWQIVFFLKIGKCVDEHPGAPDV